MSIDIPRERSMALAVGVADVLNAVIVGMEVDDTSLFDMDAAMFALSRVADEKMCAALTVIAYLFTERNILPCDVFERVPEIVAEIALADLE